MSDYKSELPDYDGTLPSLKGWHDTSWHNNACPSLGREIKDEFGTVQLDLFVEYADPAKRESVTTEGKPCPRFTFYAYFPELSGPDDGLSLAGETMEELRVTAIKWYLDNVGDSILEGDFTTAEILESVGTMWGFHNMPVADKYAKILERHVISTGKGCLAYSFVHAGHFIWITDTDTDGIHLPAEGEACLIGIRNEDGTEGSIIEAKFNAKAVISFLNEIGAEVNYHARKPTC